MPQLAFLFGAFLFLIGDAASFVAAERYEPVFALILICNLVGALAIAYSIHRRPRWWGAGLLTALLGVYSTADVALRYCLGMRFPELFT